MENIYQNTTFNGKKCLNIGQYYIIMENNGIY